MAVNAKIFLIPPKDSSFHAEVKEFTKEIWDNRKYGVFLEELLSIPEESGVEVNEIFLK